MATDTTPMPSAGTPDRNATSDHVPDVVQLAQATGAPTPAQPAPIPGVPNGEVHVTVPADQTVVRVQVAPGEIIDLPFGDDVAARFGQQGNLAVKEGDQTIILLGYAEANQQDGVTLHDSHGHNIDVASVVAQTDPNLDIQTAAGPAAGPGGQGGHLFLDFHPGAGLGGFGELNVINPTALQYGLISPDENILPPLNRLDNNGTGTTTHTLTISSSDGGVDIEVTDRSDNNTPTGSADNAAYLQAGGNEGHAYDKSKVNGFDSGDLHMGSQGSSSLAVTFQSESAVYHNMVGVVITDPDGHQTVQFLWLDATESGSGLVTDFLGNDQPTTVNINDIPAGSTVQYFLIQNGANDAGNQDIVKDAVKDSTGDAADDMADLNGKTTVVQDPDGSWHIYVDGKELNGSTLFSDKDMNVHNNQEVVSGSDGGSDNAIFVGFEDKGLLTADKDYNDVVFSVTSSSVSPHAAEQHFSPSVLLGDSANDISQITIDTTGFQVGDKLNNLADAGGFHVDVTQDPDGNYHVAITETAAHTTQQWQDFLNSIDFSSDSKDNGTRDISYTVTDSGGHTGTSTTHIDVEHQHDVSLSTEINANHPGDALIHNGATAGHDVTWGASDDNLVFDQHFTATDGKLDMGGGTNTVTTDANMNLTATDASHLENVNHIDMTAHGANVTSLAASDILSMTGDGNTLKIDGDSNDSVKLDGSTGGQWAAVSSGAPAGYHEYQWTDGSHAVTVLINDHITQAQIDTTKH